MVPDTIKRGNEYSNLTQNKNVGNKYIITPSLLKHVYIMPTFIKMVVNHQSKPLLLFQQLI